MEFLDPEEKRAKTIRLFLGYSIAIIAVLSVTTVLSFVLQGVDLFSRQTEVRNGLLFVDSKPVSADTYIDGEIKRRTEARFVLPEGRYDIKLSQEGYRDWAKNVSVIGGQVRYHVYPKLFPNEIKVNTKATYNIAPKIYSQSPDRKWLIVTPSNQTQLIYKYDLGKPEAGALSLSVPTDVISNEEIKEANFEEVEWSNDSRHVIYKKTIKNKIEYVLLDIEKPQESVNLTDVLKLNQDQKLGLWDQKFDKYYVHNTKDSSLRRADLKNGILPEIVANNVAAYAEYGKDVLLYASNANSNKEHVVTVLEGDKTANLEVFPSSETISLDIAKYENDWHFVVGANNSPNTAIYINPIAKSRESTNDIQLKPQIRLKIEDVRKVSFSDNARFIGAQSSTTIAVYDAEIKRSYRYESPFVLPPTGVTWMDGHRFRAVSGGKEQVFEFDGKNLQATIPAINGSKTYYDRDYEYSYSINKVEDKFQLVQAYLVYEPEE